MIEKHGELMLYFGLCASGGHGEGDFDSTQTDEWSTRRYSSERDNVERFLRPTYRLDLHYGIRNFAGNEDNALFLIKFAKRVIPESIAGFELVDMSHGKTRFWRKIIFPGWTGERKKELVEIMQQSEFKPALINTYPAWLYSEKERVYKEMLERKRIWGESVKFHTESPKNFCQT